VGTWRLRVVLWTLLVLVLAGLGGALRVLLATGGNREES